MSPIVVLPLLAVGAGAAVAATVLHRLTGELAQLREVLDALADVPSDLGALRAEALAAGVTSRVGPTP